MKVLVCGGAGYIGSHCVRELLDKGYEVVVFDSMVKGHAKAVDQRAKLVIGDLRDDEAMDNVFNGGGIDAVIDFAAFSLVGESVTKPFEYYDNNVGGTLNLLKKMHQYDVRKIIFSSTAATYGEPERVPIFEDDRKEPTNPYGETKLAVEKMLKWADVAYGIKHVVLRYFNVAGAHADGMIGEDHKPETHLIPKILEVALGKEPCIKIFGTDYDTEDGTCIRDYIHVTDLSNAHILALELLIHDNVSNSFNLGNGNGFSVKQVIDVARKVTGHDIPQEIYPRRAGDPARLVTNADKITALGWERKFASLEQIIETAWNWHKNHPQGYES